MRDITGRVAVVTGASSGIGVAISHAFAGAGVKTVLAARSVDRLEAVARAIESKGGTALVCETNVTSGAGSLPNVVAMTANANKANSARFTAAHLYQVTRVV